MMLYRNVAYFVLGTLLGAIAGVILGILVCDETKRSITKAIHNKAKLLIGGFKKRSEKTMDTVKDSVGTVKNSVKDLS